MTTDLAYLANFSNPTAKYINYLNSYTSTIPKNKIYQMKIVFYNNNKTLFFYTQPALAFYLLRDLCMIYDHIVSFYLFLL